MNVALIVIAILAGIWVLGHLVNLAIEILDPDSIEDMYTRPKEPVSESADPICAACRKPLSAHHGARLRLCFATVANEQQFTP